MAGGIAAALKTWNRKLFFSGLVMVLLLLSGGRALAESPERLLALGDEMYRGRADLAKAKMSVEYYRQAMAAAPDNYEAALKLSTALCWVADHGPKDKDFRRSVSAEAVEAAEKAVQLRPDFPGGHFHLAVAQGFYGDARGMLKTLFLVQPIRQSLAEVIRIDPGYEKGGAYLGLGRLYFFIPGFVGGGLEKAVANLETALKYGPDRWINHLYLAEAYIKDGRGQEARALLDRIIKGPAEPGLEPEYEEWKGEAEYWLHKLDEAESD